MAYKNAAAHLQDDQDLQLIMSQQPGARQGSSSEGPMPEFATHIHTLLRQAELLLLPLAEQVLYHFESQEDA